MRLLALAALAACSSPPTLTERVPPAGPRRPPDRIPPVSISAGAIVAVAIAERGDTALSVDSIGEVRLWPALDGTRAPVTLHALDASRDVAIGAGGADGLIAAGLDGAGNVKLVRLTREGAVRGTAVISAGESTIVQIAAIDGGILVRRNDQSIERYDATGAVRGRLVGDPGERLGAFAARHGAAMILVLGAQAEGSTTATTVPQFFPTATGVRAIALEGNGLAWGPRHAFPDEVAGRLVRNDSLALSPSHTRIAVVDVNSGSMRVLDAADLHELGYASTNEGFERPAIGFTDDDDAVALGRATAWWRAHGKQSADLSVVTGAVGDGRAIAGYDLMLALDQPDHVSYLGWGRSATGYLAAAGDHIALFANAPSIEPMANDLVVVQEEGNFNRRAGRGLGRDDDAQVLLLDDRLHVWQTRSVPGTPVAWIDERHAVCDIAKDGDNRLVLADLEVPGRDLLFGSAGPLDGSPRYEPSLHELEVPDRDGTNHRFAFDTDFSTVTTLPAIASSVRAELIQLVDPKTHGGLVAIGLAGGDQLYEWRDGAGPVIAQALVAGPGSQCVRLAEGGGYSMIHGDLVGFEGANACVPHVAFAETTRVAPRADGQRLAAYDAHTFSMYDAAGRRLWQRDLWGISAIVFAHDRSTVVVSTTGGLVAFDTDSGERVGAACGFEFGLHDDPAPPRGARDEPTECEE